MLIVIDPDARGVPDPENVPVAASDQARPRLPDASPEFASGREGALLRCAQPVWLRKPAR